MKISEATSAGKALGGTRGAVVVIRPDSGHYLPDLKELWSFRQLLFMLVWRSVRVRYKNSTLGVVWIALQPLLRMLIYTLIFGFWARIPVGGDLPYSVHALSGLVLVFFLNRMIGESANAVRANQALTRKVYFPKLILPSVTTISSVIDLLVTLVLLFIIMAVLGVMPAPQIVYAPLFLLLLIAWGFAIGIWFAALGIRFADIAMVIPVVTMLTMFMSPIIYPLTLVPENLLPIYALNPMVGIISGFRWAVLGVEPFYLWTVAIAVGETVILGLLGLIYFVRTERHFNDYL